MQRCQFSAADHIRMKIDRIELSLLELPYVHYFETSFGREESRTFILVRVYSEGLCGYGEVVADRSPYYSYETTSTAWMTGDAVTETAQGVCVYC